MFHTFGMGDLLIEFYHHENQSKIKSLDYLLLYPTNITKIFNITNCHQIWIKNIQTNVNRPFFQDKYKIAMTNYGRQMRMRDR